MEVVGFLSFGGLRFFIAPNVVLVVIIFIRFSRLLALLGGSLEFLGAILLSSSNKRFQRRIEKVYREMQYMTPINQLTFCFDEGVWFFHNFTCFGHSRMSRKIAEYMIVAFLEVHVVHDDRFCFFLATHESLRTDFRVDWSMSVRGFFGCH